MEKYKEELLPKLKKLPVPELNDTLVALSDWLRPLVTLEELKDFQKRAIAFNVLDGLVLQKRLVDYAQNMAGSWLAPLWTDSYLANRGHLQSESNFALVIDERYYNKIESKKVRAVQLIYQMTNVYLNLVNGTYPIEYTKNNQPIDMSFYLNFFKSCRIPGKEQDSFYRGEMQTADNYIVIFVNGIYFRLQVTNHQGEIKSLDQIMEGINYILSSRSVPKQGEHLIPYFTGVKREQSTLIYHQLKKEKQNSQNLQQIEQALFVLSFSDGKDESKEERITEVLLNTSHQFLSKTTQAVITKNGHLGFNMEHTAIDGVPTLNLFTNIFESFNNLEQRLTENSSADLVQRVEWVLTSQMINTLEKAQELVQIENHSYILKHHVFSIFGKERMKKADVSPDAFVHIALAMAQQKVFGKLRSVYEPVAMRMYFEGRTESARSISQEKKLFAEAFYSETESLSKQKLIELFTEAATAHSARIAQCQKGKGVERHLFGLQKMALSPEEGLTFFSTEALKRLEDDFISTTGIPYDILESFSFGPVNKTGFGLYYGILDEKIILTISAKKVHQNEAIQLLEDICTALIALTELLGM